MALLQTGPIQWPPLNMGHLGPLFARRQAGHRTGRLRPATGWAGIRVEAVPRRLPSWGSVPLRERPARKTGRAGPHGGCRWRYRLNLGARLAWAAQLHLYMYFDSCTNEFSQSPGMSPCGTLSVILSSPASEPRRRFGGAGTRDKLSRARSARLQLCVSAGKDESTIRGTGCCSQLWLSWQSLL
jgi:hypothetical protein